MTFQKEKSGRRSRLYLKKQDNEEKQEELQNRGGLVKNGP